MALGFTPSSSVRIHIESEISQNFGEIQFLDILLNPAYSRMKPY